MRSLWKWPDVSLRMASSRVFLNSERETHKFHPAAGSYLTHTASRGSRLEKADDLPGIAMPATFILTCPWSSLTPNTHPRGPPSPVTCPVSTGGKAWERAEGSAGVGNAALVTA